MLSRHRLVASAACGILGVAAASLVPSAAASPLAATAAPSPAPSASPALDAVWQLRAGGPPGDSESFDRLAGATRRYISADPAVTDPAIVHRLGTAFAIVTYATKGATFIVPLRDLAASVPRAEKPTNDARTPLGYGKTYPQLLASIRRDPALVGKRIVKAPDGTLLLVETTTQDPPPVTYDHGFKATIYTYYFFRAGRVAASEIVPTEN